MCGATAAPTWMCRSTSSSRGSSITYCVARSTGWPLKIGTLRSLSVTLAVAIQQGAQLRPGRKGDGGRGGNGDGGAGLRVLDGALAAQALGKGPKPRIGQLGG